MLNINNISSRSDTFQDLPFVFRDLISLLTEKLREKRTKKYKKRTVTWKRPNLFQELVTFLWPELDEFFPSFPKRCTCYLDRNFQRFNSESLKAGACNDLSSRKCKHRDNKPWKQQSTVGIKSPEILSCSTTSLHLYPAC